MQLLEVLYDIFEIENIDSKLKSTNQKRAIDANSLLLALCNGETKVAATLGVSDTTYTRTIKFLWPEKPVSSKKLRTYLLEKYLLKYCSSCKEVKEVFEFSKNASSNSGYNSHCKECCLHTRREYQKIYQAQRRALKLQRTPKWSEKDKILEFYLNCPEGYHVDHIIPLQGKLVSELHVLSNLQYLTAEQNIKKSNSFNINFDGG